MSALERFMRQLDDARLDTLVDRFLRQLPEALVAVVMLVGFLVLVCLRGWIEGAL